MSGDEMLSTVVFSPDGTLIATASHDETVRVWSVEDGGLLLTATSRRDAPTCHG